MHLSVVLPIFNEAAYLPECLDSLFHQKRPADEVICCIDNRTWDGSGLIARSYHVRLLIVHSKKLCVRDAGIRQAKGDVIVSVDADCIYPDTFLADVDRIFRDKQVVAASGWHPWPIPMPMFVYHLWHGNRLSGSGSAFRRQAYFDIGGFDLTIDQHDHRQMSYEEERGFFLKMQALGKIGWIDTPCYHRRPWSSRI